MKRDNKLYTILAIVIFVVIVPICAIMASKQNKDSEVIKKENLSLIHELINYDNLDNMDINSNNSINKCKSFIIVRNTKDGWVVDRAYNGQKINKKWTKEDLLIYDLIVFVVSGYEGKAYQDAAGNTKYLTSESIIMYYYNITENSIFEKEYIEGEELKDIEKYNHEISSNTIFDKIKKRFIK